MSLQLRAQELQLWNCQSTNATGFNWNTEEGYRWENEIIPKEITSMTNVVFHKG